MSPKSAGSDASLGGLGSLLYNIHSKGSTFYGRMDEVDLKFYEHVIVATQTTRLCCFPKKYEVKILPRFKIVDVTMTLGPRRVNETLTSLLFFLAACLITFGAVFGGCGVNCDSYYGTCTGGTGPCACLVIGIMLLIPMVYATVFPWCRKWHHLYFDVRRTATSTTTNFFNRSGIETYEYRLRKTGGDIRSHEVHLDEMFIAKYAYGSLSLGGTKATSQAHIFSHFNSASLATPIMPVYADKTIAELVVPKLLQHRPRPRPPPPKPMRGEPMMGNKDEVHEAHEGRFVDISSNITPPLTPVSHPPATFMHGIDE